MIKNFLLDLIFPRFCLGCKKELSLKQASFICEACLNNIVLNSGVECHVCGLRNKNVRNRVSNIICCRCRKKTFLNGLFAAGKYQDPILREAIHQFKYQSVESLKKPLAELLIKYLKKENLIEKLQMLEARFPTFSTVLAPIPLSRRRKLSRGFNQSELLAKELSPALSCPVINLLKRQKFSAPQAKIKDWQQRKENISGAFTLNLNLKIIPVSDDRQLMGQFGNIKKVILIDDVATSDATLEEAARVLKQAGVKEVYGLVIAKG
ncbi:MAG: ComF family protein [Parcubacteria group bacterium]|nr:ComF family protein [Parcubacteria group bacterium]